MEPTMIYLYRAFFWLLTYPLALLPLPAGRRVGAFLAGLGFRLWKQRRLIALHNVTRTMEEGTIRLTEPPEELARRSFENMGRSIVEMFRLYHGRDKELLASVRMEGAEHFEAARAKGKGLIFITGHFGNWELLGPATRLRFGIRISAVARAQNNPHLDWLVERMRGRRDKAIIYKEGAVKGILRELKAGAAVGILIDQATLANEGVMVPFLGRAALTTRLPALVARKTGTPIVPIFIHREPDGGHVMVISPEVRLSTLEDKDQAVLEDTRTLTAHVEQAIEAYPDQWLWGHRRWKRAAETLEASHGLDMTGRRT
jgi:KDO2-lipid IV(A) lauroyltransferase